ncbi:hypothetical protein NL676_039390, partial [Syzygium grande]
RVVRVSINIEECIENAEKFESDLDCLTEDIIIGFFLEIEPIEGNIAGFRPPPKVGAFCPLARQGRMLELFVHFLLILMAWDNCLSDSDVWIGAFGFLETKVFFVVARVAG